MNTGTELHREQRRHSRVPFDAPARLIGTDAAWTSQLIDISLKGALIRRPAGWQGRPGDFFMLELLLGENGGPVVRMEATVARSDSSCIGLVCEFIDVDSITHLRRLVELNLANPDMLGRELAALG